MAKHLRKRVFETLEIRRGESRLARTVQLSLMGLICLNVAAVILESEPCLHRHHANLLHWFDVASVAVFTIEYALRLWSSTEDPRWHGALIGRLKYAITGMAVVDLLAVLPFYAPMLLPIDLRFLRVLRLFRVFRVLKMARYSSSLQMLSRAITSKKAELSMTVFVVLILLILSSSLMYHAEHNAQPDAFASIPSAMWWAVVTLTTVGYGDVYPATAAGKVIASVISILGVALFAMPTAILASAFMEQMRPSKAAPTVCPHCGKPLE